MVSLGELQVDFRDAILGAGELPRHPAIVADGIPSDERLAIHRNNSFTSLTVALESVYCVVSRLVGDEFFAFAARNFIRLHPPRGGCIIDYGKAFPQFLERFPPAASLEYLPDVARLEWAWHVAFHSAEAEPLEPSGLKELRNGALSHVSLNLHPSRRFVVSDYPIDRIWAANQAEQEPEETIDLSMGGATLLVIRPRLEVEVRSLSPGVFALLMALDTGLSLANAFESAARIDSGFDLRQSLYDLIVGETFIGFTLDREEKNS